MPLTLCSLEYRQLYQTDDFVSLSWLEEDTDGNGRRSTFPELILGEMC